MTREEALRWLDTIPTVSEQVDALEMAIEALKENESLAKTVIEASELLRKKRPHGEWKHDPNGWFCSACDHGWEYVKTPSDFLSFNFCPNCGADMREGDEKNQNPCIKCSAESVCQGICEKRYLWNLRKEGEAE